VLTAPREVDYVVQFWGEVRGGPLTGPKNVLAATLKSMLFLEHRFFPFKLGRPR
jgi:hypothetical protein